MALLNFQLVLFRVGFFFLLDGVNKSRNKNRVVLFLESTSNTCLLRNSSIALFFLDICDLKIRSER